MDQRERERVIAVERFRNEEAVAATCATLGRSRAWLYKWAGRARDGGEDWFKARSRCPGRTRRTIPEVEDRVEAVRLFLAFSIKGGWP